MSKLLDPPVRRRSLRAQIQLLAGAGAVVMGLASLALPAAYIVESPGPIFNTTADIDGEPVISVSGDDTFETDGSLSLTTVYVNGAPTSSVRVPDAVHGWFNPTIDITPAPLVYPQGTTADEVSEANSAAMTSSQDLAIAAAFEELDIDFDQELAVFEFTDQARQAGVDDLLEPQDVLVNAGGEDVTGIEGVREVVNNAAGQPVELTVVRNGEHLDVEVPTYQELDGEYYAGIMFSNEFDFPLDIDIRLENVGGPSAGLMFTLGLIDTLNEESMTGGEQWAGTGTVDPDGRVGAIGGIAQKVVGARNSGANYFLAPEGNCAELDGRTPGGLEVFGVADVAQAREIVEAVRDGNDDFLASQSTCGD